VCRQLYNSPPMVVDNYILIQIFVVGTEKRMNFEMEYLMANQCHPRSMISVPIDSKARICDLY